jgi:ankyrin repeat protein
LIFRHRYNRCDLLAAVLERGPPFGFNDPVENGTTALHIAAECGYLQVECET